MVGGEEILRDEQIYLAHKCANPSAYLPPDDMMDDAAREQVKKYKPTDVQLQVWDGLCHVGPTLSFTSPAKYQYRAIAQFGAWALAHAQKTEIDILDDDEISFISSASSSSEGENGNDNGNGNSEQVTPEQSDKDQDDQKRKEGKETGTTEKRPATGNGTKSIGKTGDPLPPFKDHMIRQRVTSHGIVFPLPPPEELTGCTMDRNLIGVVKVGTVRKWLEHKKRWDNKFAKTKRRVHEERIREMSVGYEVFGEGEFPPPSALAGRRKISKPEAEPKKRVRSLGMSLWSLWGSKHDEMTVQREQEADGELELAATSLSDGEGARQFSDLQKQEGEKEKGRRVSRPGFMKTKSRSHSHMRIVRDEKQVEESSGNGGASSSGNGGSGEGGDERTPIEELLALRRKKNEELSAAQQQQQNDLLSPNDVPPTPAPDTGVTGKRPFLDGISLPFSLGKRKIDDNASMMTLNSAIDGDPDRSSVPSPRALTPNPEAMSSQTATATNPTVLAGGQKELEVPTPLVSPSLASPGESRPELERFVTAQESVPLATPKMG